MNKQLTEELRTFLQEAGAALVGFGDLTGLPAEQTLGYPTGVSIAVCFSPEVILEVRDQPGPLYKEAMAAANQKLEQLMAACEAFLTEKGFKAWAQNKERTVFVAERVTRLPHKTVATRAGLGWIGKHCLLVTPEYGSAIRLGSILTDAPLEYGQAIDSSRCGDCRRCVEGCTTGALKGTPWEAGMERSEIFAPEICTTRTSACGKCFAGCVHTDAYLERTKK